MAFGALNDSTFDLSGGATTQGPLSTAPAPSTPSPGLNSFDASGYGLGGGKEAKLEKFAGIIQSGGTLTPSQEAKLSNISGKAGLDFASTLGYTPTSERYTYTPTPDPAGVRAQNYTGNDIRIADSGGSGDVTAVAQYGAQPQGGMVENPWEASAGDLYQNLNPNQEAKFNKFAGMYAAGEDLRPGQLNKLDKFLGMADLGTRESYFAPATYTGTTPEDFSTRANGMTYEDLAKLYTTGDPILLYAAAQKYGITPEEIQTALGGYSKSYYAPTAFESDIQSRLSAGQSDYADLQLAALLYKDPDNEMFNDPGVRSRAEVALYTYQNPVTGPTSATTTNRRGEEIAGSGQYGMYNNAPILSAEVFDRIIGDRNRIGGDAIKSDLLDELGWNFQSGEDLTIMQKGVRVLGLNEKQYTPEALAAMDAGQMTVDPDTGVTFDTSASARQNLETAAERIGIDPAQYESAADLYAAVERASQDLYQVIGGYKNQWADEASNIINPKTGEADRGNHANVIYRNVNGQLMPIAADLFKYERPKDPIIGGTVGEIMGSVPFLPEVVGFATGNPYIYAGLKGAQTASRPGAEFSDVAVSTALAYFTPIVAKEISGTIEKFIPVEFAQSNPLLTDFITKAGTNISMALATSALRGQDINLEDLVTSTLMASGIQTATGEMLKLTDFPPEMQKVLTNVIARVAMGGDIQSAVTNAITRVGINALRNSGQQQTTTQQTAG